MIALFGIITLRVALCFALLQAILPLWGYARRNIYLLASARPLACIQCFFVFSAYLLLTSAFVSNDFSILYVAANSHPSLPLFYKITAVFGAHEGSILLWIVMLSLWTMVFSQTKTIKHSDLYSLTLAILGALCFCFLCFLIFTSNPFLTSLQTQNAQDLNPLLQDPGFLLHPPMLYAGYVGFSVSFALTQAALLFGHLDRNFIALMRRFALAAWCFLTLGIILGSWWAYHVLGWGGFWFWDPVENASLLPWLSGTALIHVLLLSERAEQGKKFIAVLALITFSLSLLGTFLVRSGLLISVHSFASDPKRGIFLLLLLAVVVVTALVIYTLRIPALVNKNPGIFSWKSRELALIINSALLLLAMSIILLGTLYPFILEALHLGTISVGAPYFNQVMLPMSLIIIGFMAWSTYSYMRSNIAMCVAHSGFVLLVAAVFLTSVFSQEREVRIHEGSATSIGPYQFFFIKTEVINGPNYRSVRADFDVFKNKHYLTTLSPEKRIYLVRNMLMTKVAIHPGIVRDLYLALGEPLDKDDWSLRLYYKPFIRLIWLGGLIMILGGLMAIFQRIRKVNT